MQPVNNARILKAPLTLSFNECRSLVCDCSPSSYSETAYLLRMNLHSLSEGVSGLLEYGRKSSINLKFVQLNVPAACMYFVVDPSLEM